VNEDAFGGLRGLDPKLPLADRKTMQAQINENISVDRMIPMLVALRYE
jgi:hypothetical protein